MIINILFAIQLEDFNDQIYQKLENGYARILEALGFKNLLPNLFPIFLSFPPYRKELSNIIEIRDELETLIRGLLKRVEDDLEKKPCVSQDFLQKLNEGTIDELSVIVLCNDFMLAGTVSPQILFEQKAHDELDRVVGCEHLPNISDFNSLPYIQSLIKETLRWIPLIIILFRLGDEFAEVKILSILSGLLWTFKIENVKRDATGRVLPIDLNDSIKSVL
ncbi:hypothetical protein G9A89_023445 [Geosiphon pyriformis]|nr:hypothetical protein G9A89_023445 [Geosiphon pyriformis]